MKTLHLYKKGIEFTIFVDDDDFELIKHYRWYIYESPLEYTPYAKATINGKVVSMHRFLLNAPKDLVTDHIDMNGLNNQRSNLRLITRHQNNMGKRKYRNGRSSRFKGVHFSHNANRWIARIKVETKNLHLGAFINEMDAARAYDRGAIKYFGEYARLNFPPIVIPKPQ